MTAPAELVISVTADDIALGERESACRCPIARAVARLLGVTTNSEQHVAVERTEMDVWFPADPSATVAYLLPVGAGRFITAFDSGDAVEPITFTARLNDLDAS